MVVLTTLVGWVIAAPRPLEWLIALHAVFGTALVAGGAATLNQVLEHRTDARMRRTSKRPLPSGRLDPVLAQAFGVGIAVLGMSWLAFFVNLLTAVLGGMTLAAYVFVYTPMKLKSSLATIVGAIPGAIPPMMGCAAATDRLDLIAWALFGILFLWQIPHFLAIAWLYRKDYASGGFPMLTVSDPDGRLTGRQAVLYAAALVPVSLLPSVLGTTGWFYLASALASGIVFFVFTVRFALARDMRTARKLVLVSVAYLPIVLILMIFDQIVI